MTEPAQHAESALDLLSTWQSLHALLPPHLRAETDDLNRQTLAVLEGWKHVPWGSQPPCAELDDCRDGQHSVACPMSAHSDGSLTCQECGWTADDEGAAMTHECTQSDGPDLCFALTEDNGSFCGRTLPCPEHNDGADDAR